MENYQGIKFGCNKTGESFKPDGRLDELDKWVWFLAELGLAPVHAEGAYGNHSFRLRQDSFVITRTGMTPRSQTCVDDYCLVEGFDKPNGTFSVRGKHEPSSESVLHLFIYRAFPWVATVMHGHSNLLNRYAQVLGIPVTSEKLPYGTLELADSAVEVIGEPTPFIILRDHGFVAMGHDIDTTGKLVLAHFAALIDLLRK